MYFVLDILKILSYSFMNEFLNYYENKRDTTTMN